VELIWVFGGVVTAMNRMRLRSLAIPQAAGY